MRFRDGLVLALGLPTWRRSGAHEPEPKETQ